MPEHAKILEMPFFRLSYFFLFFHAKPNLNRVIAVFFFCTHSENDIRKRTNKRYRHDIPRCVKNLSHMKFFSKKHLHNVKITNSEHQIPNNIQIQMTEIQNVLNLEFGISNLFVIW